MSAPSPLIASLSVMLGGGFGALLRYQLGRGMTHYLGTPAIAAFPWATLAANILGSLAMGLLAGWLVKSGGNEQMRLLIGVGLLGGFTTFSSFSLEMINLIERGQTLLGLTYAAVSVLAGLAALYIGLVLMRGQT